MGLTRLFSNMSLWFPFAACFRAFVSLFVAAVLLKSAIAAETQLSVAKVNEILRVAMAENGYLTQDMHDEFWRIIQENSSASEREMLIEVFLPAIKWGQEYQVELWTSAELSFANESLTKTPRLEEMQSNLDETFESWLSKASDMPYYRQMVQESKRGLESAVDNAQKLLTAAANRAPMPFPEVPSIRLDAKYIQRVLSRIEDSFARVRNLLDPDWKD